MNKKALIDVWNKDKLIEFAQELSENYNFDLIAEESSYNLLKENNIKSEKLNYEDISGETSEEKIKNFDIAIINIYPIEEAVDKDLDETQLTQAIDITRHNILRAAAKNNKKMLIVSSVNQYKEVINELKERNGDISLKLKRDYALKAFEKTLNFDSRVLQELSDRFEEDRNNYFSLNIKKSKNLRYGENPHQTAALYFTGNTIDYEVLNGDLLSYNNIIDSSVCSEILSEFYDVCACIITKHASPCCAALGKDIEEAWLKAVDCDPLSAFNGIAGFTQVVNENLAKQLSSIFLDIIIAPDYTPKALNILKQNKRLIVIKLNTSLEEYKNYINEEIKVTPFGTIVQTSDKCELDKDKFKVVTKTKPTAEMVEDMVFAWKIVKHAKSNAVVIAKDFKAIGIGQGQTSRQDAFELALNKACDGSKNAVAASDGCIESINNIQAAAQGRISGIIQTGGSSKDENIFKTADKYNISMITTGIRHFKH